MYEGRLNIPCVRLEDESRETVGRVYCLYFVKLMAERENCQKNTGRGSCRPVAVYMSRNNTILDGDKRKAEIKSG